MNSHELLEVNDSSNNYSSIDHNSHKWCSFEDKSSTDSINQIKSFCKDVLKNKSKIRSRKKLYKSSESD